MIEAQRRSGETVVAMGMAGALAQRWAGLNNRYIAATCRLSDIAGSLGSISKVLRLLLQSVILGVGAYLVLRQELTAGAMVAASIMMGRRAKASPGCPRRSRAPRRGRRPLRCRSRRAASRSSR